MRIIIPKAIFDTALQEVRDYIFNERPHASFEYHLGVLAGFAHTLGRIALNREQVLRWYHDCGVYDDLSEL